MDFLGRASYKHPISKFTEICQVGAKLMLADGQMERHETLRCFFWNLHEHGCT
jgi:hypothetical protein